MSHGGAPRPRRIVLVGVMAAGKSTVGALLADRLGWAFVDLDRVVRGRTGRSPAEVIRGSGEAAFRDLEARLTAELAGRSRVVIAPGGGWVTRPELAERLGPGTVRIWLRISPEEAVRRAAADTVDRPLLEGPEGRVVRAAELLRSREPLYERAEWVVDVDERRPAAVVDEILRRLGLDQEETER